MPSASIGDGFDFKGHVEPQPRLWDRITFQYRPALPDEVFEYRDAPRASGKQTLAAMTALLAGHVKSWDAKDAAGNLIPLTSRDLGRIHPRILDTMANYVVGSAPPDAEDGKKLRLLLDRHATERRLRHGLNLILYHPVWAGRTCQDCKRFQYNDGDDGDHKPLFRHDWDRVKLQRIDIPVLRPRGEPTPCYKCPKIPKGTPNPCPEEALELDGRLWLTWRHYLSCKATGQFPIDRIVFRHAGILREIEDDWQRSGLTEAVIAGLSTILGR